MAQLGLKALPAGSLVNLGNAALRVWWRRSMPPTPAFTTIFPILTTADLEGALAFYRDLLGATVTYQFTGPDGEPGYVGLELGDAHLGIGRDPDAERRADPALQPVGLHRRLRRGRRAPARRRG